MAEMVYTVAEAAEILRCSKDYIYKLIKCGRIKVLKIPQTRIRKETLERFLEKWEGYDLTSPSAPEKLEDANE